MTASGNATKVIVPSFVVQEEGTRKVLVYLDIPDLRVKRSFPNLLKFVPSNGREQVLDFQNQSFTFTIRVQTKLYSISVARLPGEIQPEHCSIEYRRGGCWITLRKLQPTPWMNKIGDDINPGLDTREDDNLSSQASAPAKEVQLKATDMPPPFSSVPFASTPPSQAATRIKKAPAPLLPTN